MDWSSHIYMNPDSWEVKAKVSSDEETGARTLGITTILGSKKEEIYLISTNILLPPTLQELMKCTTC